MTHDLATTSVPRHRDDADTVPVVFIAGFGRSGSTLLERLLADRLHAVAVGEVSQAWHHGFLENRRCSCGARCLECGFWSSVADRTRAATDPKVVRVMSEAHADLLRGRNIPAAFTERGRARLRRRLPPRYDEHLADLYRGMNAAAPGRLLIDSSKHPLYLEMLRRVPCVDLTVVHLVRDPRAAAWSWTRERPEPGTVEPTYMRRYRPFHSGVQWTLWNSLLEGPLSSTRDVCIRYEDIVSNLDRVVAELLEVTPTRRVPASSDGAPAVHSVSGNPLRFAQSAPSLVADEEFAKRMPRRQQIAVSAVTLPILRRHGYPAWVRRPRPPVLFIAWNRSAGRATEIADSLDGEAAVIWPRWAERSRLLRYAVSSVLTIWHLVRSRPKAVVTGNPPIVVGLLAFIIGRLQGSQIVLDSHPSSFGRKADASPLARKSIGVHRALARRSAAVMVTTQPLAREVDDWGGRGIPVHEAPPCGPEPRLPDRHDPLRVLFVSVFAADEPIDPVVEAARQLPGVIVSVTGDVDRMRPGARAQVPSNVRFTGYLRGPEYRCAIEAADIVLVLSTEPESIMRAACEAVYALRPLIFSDSTSRRTAFPLSTPVANNASSIALAVQQIAASWPDVVGQLAEARRIQLARWTDQLAQLHHALHHRSAPAGPSRKVMS